LAEILAELETMKVVQRSYVVVSDDGLSLGTFPNFLSVPPRIRDDEKECDVAVTRANLEVRYKVTGL